MDPLPCSPRSRDSNRNSNLTPGEILTTSGSISRKRAAIACTHCNARRVKCDVSISGPPCSRCRSTSNTAECQIYQSRRGRYVRRKTNPSLVDQHLSTHLPASDSTGQQRFNQQQQHNDAAVPLLDVDLGVDVFQDEEGILDTRQTSSAEPTRPSSPKSQSDATYADLLDDNRQTSVQQQPGSTILYVGNPMHTLSYTVHQRCPSETQHPLHYSVIDNAAVIRSPPPQNAVHNSAAPSEFDLPSKAIQDELIKVYFSVVHPAYPFLDRIQFAWLYSQGNPSTVGTSTSLSIMLLVAVLMTAFTHCSVSTLNDAGFKSRMEAKRVYFRHAKRMWEKGQETDRIISIQVLLLFQFWWTNPTEQRDGAFWLNSAISLAQGCGMHRSTARSGLPAHQMRLWKRIWACLRIRDGHMAAALGRPLHIYDDDCDLEPLEESDFFEEGVEQINRAIFSRSTQQHYLYFVNMSKLSGIVRLISMGHRPHGSLDSLAKAAIILREWADNLEPELKFEGRYSADFWVKILHIFYNYLLILINRPSDRSKTDDETGYNSVARPARIINSIFEELLEEDEIRFCPSHINPALFAAMSIHVAMVGSKERSIAAERIAKCRLRLSMIAMKELSEYWPVCSWIFQLFTKIIREKRHAATDTSAPSDLRSSNDVPVENGFWGVNQNSQFMGNTLNNEIFGMLDEFALDMPDGSNFNQTFDVDLDAVTNSLHFHPSRPVFPHF